jgi:AraC-like DNA-binding protein
MMRRCSPRRVTLNRTTLLHATADLTAHRFDHPPDQSHHDPEREVADHWGIAFVRAGRFGLTVDGKDHHLVKDSVFLPRPGLEFRCVHDACCPDDVCLALVFDPAAVAGAEHGWARAGWAALREPTPRLAYVQRRLAHAVDAGNQFETERWALAAVASLEADSQDARARGHYAVRRADIDLVIAACRAIETDPTQRRSIAQRARDLGLTSTRLTHLFRRYLGVSPHQYVVRHRLAASTALLDQGRGVSDSCWDSGFENLSHFCRSFQRAFGVRASAWSRSSLAERRRKVQAFLGVAR